MNNLAIILSDYYKQCHADQYDPSIIRLVSYYVPRSSRIKGWDFVPVVGIQRFIKEYLIDYFNENFFYLNWDLIESEYKYIMNSTFDQKGLGLQRIHDLWTLGYLPLEISSLPEGIKCPINCPMIQITNTHPLFPWVVNLIESLMSSQLWHPMITARVGYEYRNIVNKYYDLTSDSLENAKHAICDFSLRGTMGIDAGSRGTMGFLMSFDRTATIPAICDIKKYYGDSLDSIGKGMRSGEHSVMTSSYAIDEDEETLIERLLTEVYPDGNFAMVCDSYDYWNVVDNILPNFKEEILSRNGTLYVRGDSGDPVEIITQTVFHLWDTFGGTTNSKGYKVLDSHIRAIYGDSITQQRAEKIYDTLEKAGFAADNVALGAGSFSMLCYENEDGTLSPYTRDSFSVAIKSCAGKYIDVNSYNGHDYRFRQNQEIQIYKNPKTDTGHFKKSHKGWVGVYKADDGSLYYKDNLTFDQKESNLPCDLLRPIFRDGNLLRTTTFNEIRQRFWDGKF